MITMLKMQFTVWNATQRLNCIKDNNVYNGIDKRVFNKSFLWFWKGKRSFYSISNHLYFHVQQQSNSVSCDLLYESTFLFPF